MGNGNNPTTAQRINERTPDRSVDLGTPVSVTSTSAAVADSVVPPPTQSNPVSPRISERRKLPDYAGPQTKPTPDIQTYERPLHEIQRERELAQAKEPKKGFFRRAWDGVKSLVTDTESIVKTYAWTGICGAAGVATGLGFLKLTGTLQSPAGYVNSVRAALATNVHSAVGSFMNWAAKAGPVVALASLLTTGVQSYFGDPVSKVRGAIGAVTAAAGAWGGWLLGLKVGGLAGAWAGGKVGAAVGTLIAPGVGTAVGAVIGCAIGATCAYFGAKYGEKAGLYIGKKVHDLVTGTKVQEKPKPAPRFDPNSEFI